MNKSGRDTPSSADAPDLASWAEFRHAIQHTCPYDTSLTRQQTWLGGRERYTFAKTKPRGADNHREKILKLVVAELDKIGIPYADAYVRHVSVPLVDYDAMTTTMEVEYLFGPYPDGQAAMQDLTSRLPYFSQRGLSIPNDYSVDFDPTNMMDERMLKVITYGERAPVPVEGFLRDCVVKPVGYDAFVLLSEMNSTAHGVNSTVLSSLSAYMSCFADGIARTQFVTNPAKKEQCCRAMLVPGHCATTKNFDGEQFKERGVIEAACGTIFDVLEADFKLSVDVLVDLDSISAEEALQSSLFRQLLSESMSEKLLRSELGKLWWHDNTGQERAPSVSFQFAVRPDPHATTAATVMNRVVRVTAIVAPIVQDDTGLTYEEIKQFVTSNAGADSMASSGWRTNMRNEYVLRIVIMCWGTRNS